jgi:hypothetical protein
LDNAQNAASLESGLRAGTQQRLAISIHFRRRHVLPYSVRVAAPGRTPMKDWPPWL